MLENVGEHAGSGDRTFGSRTQPPLSRNVEFSVIQSLTRSSVPPQPAYQICELRFTNQSYADKDRRRVHEQC